MPARRSMKQWLRDAPGNRALMAAVILVLAILIAWGKVLER